MNGSKPLSETSISEDELCYRDRRKNERYLASGGNVYGFGLPPDKSDEYGIIKNISAEGLSFQYRDSGEKLKKSVKLFICLPEMNFFITQLPAKIVSELPASRDLSPKGQKIKRCCVKFGKLSKQHRSLISHFVENLTEGVVPERRRRKDRRLYRDRRISGPTRRVAFDRRTKKERRAWKERRTIQL